MNEFVSLSSSFESKLLTRNYWVLSNRESLDYSQAFINARIFRAETFIFRDEKADKFKAWDLRLGRRKYLAHATIASGIGIFHLS